MSAELDAKLYAFDHALSSGMRMRLIGLDEAGRGPIAGPVVAAAVCLDLDHPIEGINDSKKLSARRREELYDIITRQALSYATAEVSHLEIDRLNILQASLLAMRQAADCVGVAWDLALVDGNQEIPLLRCGSQLTVVDGDARSASIAAASILAKVTRDRLMDKYEQEFPGYEFSRNKGYATERHLHLLAQLGPSRIHRRSFCSCQVLQTALDLG